MTPPHTTFATTYTHYRLHLPQDPHTTTAHLTYSMPTLHTPCTTHTPPTLPPTFGTLLPHTHTHYLPSSFHSPPPPPHPLPTTPHTPPPQHSPTTYLPHHYHHHTFCWPTCLPRVGYLPHRFAPLPAIWSFHPPAATLYISPTPHTFSADTAPPDLPGHRLPPYYYRTHLPPTTATARTLQGKARRRHVPLSHLARPYLFLRRSAFYRHVLFALPDAPACTRYRLHATIPANPCLLPPPCHCSTFFSAAFCTPVGGTCHYAYLQPGTAAHIPRATAWLCYPYATCHATYWYFECSARTHYTCHRPLPLPTAPAAGLPTCTYTTPANTFTDHTLRRRMIHHTYTCIY